MTDLVPITLYGWMIVAIGLFTVMQPRRAVLAAYLLAWLFLPQAALSFSGLPDLTKVTCTSMGALAGVILFDAGRLVRFRPSWVDLPMLLWCTSSLLSALANESPEDEISPLYDGLSGVLQDIFVWGIPYLIGRLYFNDLASLRELAIGIVIGGLLYVPLCLYELRMSPSLHYTLYGFHPSPFVMTLRYGGYRPMVFMQHGLMVGMWMTSAALVATWLWSNRSVLRFQHIPMGLIALVLVAVAILCKSTGAIALLALGLTVLYATKLVKSPVILIAVLAVTPLYMVMRTHGLWTGERLVDLSESLVNQERAESFAGRLDNEDLLIKKAVEKPWFGWGGWGRWRVIDPITGKDITVSDGFWVITRGERGLFGLVAMTSLVLLPFVLLLKRCPARTWAHPAVAPAAALAMLLMLWSIDNLFNAMINPIYVLAAGGLSGFYIAFPHLRARASQTRAALLYRYQQSHQAPVPQAFEGVNAIT
ncbi:MAG: hypothetical protein L0Y44_04570 [Phycisphaerales bacterium]|nr:hypothetical protein [Phycisphaerales bacterium]MCI0629910.1 hypothetical protein [Phycisphaerales bacterium]